MTDSHAHPPAGGKGPGYETRDANVRVILTWAVILTITVLFSFWYMKWLFDHYAGELDRERPAPSALMEMNFIPPTPRLRVNAVQELAQLHAREAAQLEGYAWVDKEAGIARIPVARAIEIVAAHGLLPSWPAEPAAPVAAEATPAPAPHEVAP